MNLKLLAVLLLAAATAADAEVSELETKLLNASGTLRIADTIGHDPVVYKAALGWAAANKNVDITIEQTTLLDVTENTSGKSYDLVVYQHDPRNEFDLAPAGKKTDYAIDAAMIYVNSENPLDNIAVTALSEIFCGDLATWETLNGHKLSIRRYGAVPPGAGERPFRRHALGQLGYTDSMLFVGTAAEVVAGAAGSAGSIGFGGYSLALPVSVKTLAVNGVEPTPENLLNHTYPLLLCRTAADAGTSPAGALFVRLLTSEEAGQLAAGENLFSVSAP